MDTPLRQLILQCSGARAVTRHQHLQRLWSGYGEIARVHLHGAEMESVILKRITPPAQCSGTLKPRRSHERKMRSYQVEMAWYRHWSAACDDGCRVARCYGSGSDGQMLALVLEDLDGAGFDLRRSRLTRAEIELCLGWLAHFHARFMGETPARLWPVGSYWHLATRPDELEALQHAALKRAAAQLDRRLNGCRYQTIIHGDAKSENFCLHHGGERVAAVDFQYAGGGCGMRDVAYLLDSALSDGECEAWGAELLDHYFSTLRRALFRYGKEVEWPELEAEWRGLYAIAWADLYRFLLGWAPRECPMGRYAQGMTALALTGVT